MKIVCIQEGHAAAKAFLAQQPEFDVPKELVQGDVVAGFDIGHYTSGIVLFKFVQLLDKLTIQVLYTNHF